MSTTLTAVVESIPPLYVYGGTKPTLMSLPVELLEIMTSVLARKELVSITLTSKLFYTIGTRYLYRAISRLSQCQSVRLLRSLTRSPNDERTRKRAICVRTLLLDFSSGRVTANFLRLLQQGLQTLTSLRELSLEFGTQDNYFSLAWCLENCPFQLRLFTTSIRCDDSLAAFIEGQRKLEELILRGFQTTAPFILSPDALPKLSAFRTVHAGVPVLKQVMRGRPIDTVSISLFQEDMFEPLDTLLLPQTQIKRLTIMSLGDTPPDLLLPEISARLPALEALHIVVLMARYTYDNLLCSTQYLKPFSSLRYITFMTGCESDVIEDEKRVVYSWAKACKSLRTIILPRGKVWFEREGQWTCSQSE
ncbi:hypothetical protein QCA50_015056 [Cerrena zonata]|uniref:F-box domain-containing protein n=1 Tax=Cerrena zonata TaxID=2478898 RepID=A0AAW0FRM5_9APHY